MSNTLEVAAEAIKAPAPAPIKTKLKLDAENKSLELPIFSLAFPHMRSFHLSWMSFFLAFFASFAPAALIPVIRENLDMDKADVNNAGIAAVCGTIFSRIVWGTFCDEFGPRFGHAILMLGFSPAIFCIGLATNGTQFLLCRLFIGVTLSTFVACQYWSSSLFNPKIVGAANAVGGGWGNLGGGVTEIIMPLLYQGLVDGGITSFAAWRWAFLLPGGLAIFIGVMILAFAQDLPEGNYADMKRQKTFEKKNNWRAFAVALSNYRTWVLLWTYGYCFGIELTMFNIVVPYLYDQFHVSLTTAGYIGASFGLMNIFARPIGGYISDWCARNFGMKGRLWYLWTIQTIQGGLCIALGYTYNSLNATIVVMIFFGYFVQSSAGATFGVVPFVSRRALGVVCGFVGAGGSVGSALAQAIFFGPKVSYTTYEGIRYMGVMVVCMTVLLHLIYFPMWGGMWCGPKKGVTEEDYYAAEFTAEERAAGLHNKAMLFAAESRSQRGWKKAEAAENNDSAHGANNVVKV